MKLLLVANWVNDTSSLVETRIGNMSLDLDSTTLRGEVAGPFEFFPYSAPVIPYTELVPGPDMKPNER